MDIADLSQRYSETYIRYAKEIHYCTGFDNLKGQPIMYVQDEEGLRSHKPFDWRNVDIERPKPRWIGIKTPDHVQGVPDGMPYFMCYRTNRQWQRGFCSRNTTVWSPFDHLIYQTTRHFDPWFSVLRTLNDVRVPFFRETLTPEKLCEIVSKRTNFQILSPFICQAGEDFYYKQTRIAYYDPAEKEPTIRLVVNNFQKELEELTKGIKFLPSRPKTGQEKYVPQLRVPRGLRDLDDDQRMDLEDRIDHHDVAVGGFDEPPVNWREVAVRLGGGGGAVQNVVVDGLRPLPQWEWHDGGNEN